VLNWRVRTPIEILNEIYSQLEKANLIYELKSLRNEASHHFMPSEFIAEVGSMLLSMNMKKDVNLAIGHLIKEFTEYSIANGIKSQPSKFYSIEQKRFEIDGKNFTDLKGFYNSIGDQLVENNEWGKNWNALNDILLGGFIKTEYAEPFILTWKNSDLSKINLEDFEDIVKLIRQHEHIELELK
jgi:RNAse (barnase) inhibitor barstar